MKDSYGCTWHNVRSESVFTHTPTGVQPYSTPDLQNRIESLQPLAFLLGLPTRQQGRCAGAMTGAEAGLL